MDKEEFLKALEPKPYLLSNEYDFAKRIESFYLIAKTMIPGFDLSANEITLYENAIKYFSGDNAGEWPLNKGIYLYGKIGSGKTTFFKILCKLNEAAYTGNGFSILTVNSIVEGFAKSGFEYLEKFNASVWNISNHLLLDDLGQSASTVKHYGTGTNIVSEFIQRRYYVYKSAYKLTHISTNMEPSEIKTEYGEFISSRMKEMFHIVLYPGADKRK